MFVRARVRYRTTYTVAGLALGFILLCAYLLRTYYATTALHGDEGFTCSMILQNFAGIIRQTLELSEPHPVGYYFMLKAWLYFGGDSELAQRTLSMAFGVLSVAWIARLGHQLIPGRRGTYVAMLAAVLMATNALAIWQSRETRMYSALLALVLGSTSLMVEMIERPRPITWLGYVVLTWLALQTHYYALFGVVAQNLYVGCLWLSSPAGKRRPLLVHWLTAQLAVAVFTLPWLYIARDILLSYHGFGTMPNLGQALTQVLYWFSGGPHDMNQPLLLAAAGGLLLIIGLGKMVKAGPRQRRSALLLVLYLLVPLLAIWWLSQSRPVYKDRYLIQSLAPYQLILAVALVPDLSDLKKRQDRLKLLGQVAPSVILGGVLGIGIVSGTATYMGQELAQTRNKYVGMYSTFTRLSASLPPDRVRWVVTYPDYAFTCYLGTPSYTVMPYLANDQASADAVSREFRDKGVQRVLLMVVEDNYWNGHKIAPVALAKDFTQIAETSTGEWPVKVYSRIDASRLRSIDTKFQDGIILDSERTFVDVPARLVVVHLKWSTDNTKLRADEKLFIHVVKDNEPGRIVTQLDVPFTSTDLAGDIRTYGVPLPEELANTSYQVQVGLYNSDLANMPRVLTQTGEDKIVLRHFTIPASRERRR